MNVLSSSFSQATRLLSLTTAAVFLVIGCAPTASVQSGEEVQEEMDLPEYSGPKANIAVGPCRDKTGGSGRFEVKTEEGTREVSIGGEIGSGMSNMLVTALVNTDRFIVLESNSAVLEAMAQEQKIEGDSAAQGKSQSADLIVSCAVTSFEPKASGGEGGVVNLVGGWTGTALSAISGGTEKSTATLDFRLVDTDTRAILEAFNVEGAARDVSLGGALVGAFSGGAGLGVFSNTPIEKAIRIAILKAVKEVSLETPERYFSEGTAAASDSLGESTSEK